MNRHIFEEKKQFHKYSDRLIPVSVRLPLILVLLWNGIAYYGGRVISQNRLHHCFETGLDRSIPFVPWTVSVYLVSFLFWTVNYCLAARRDRTDAYRLFCADFITRMVCLAFFVLLPTTNIRPAVPGNDIWAQLMRMVYRLDAADNMFPSIHCIASFLAAAGISGEKDIPAWYRCFSWLMAGAICISTLTTKQHVMADVIGALLIESAAYGIAARTAIQNSYSRMVGRIACLLRRIFGIPDTEDD